MVDQATIHDAVKPLTNAFSPNFLHSSDQPNQFLVDVLLDGDKYMAWHRSITRALNVKNKIGFVLSTIKRPITNTIAINIWYQ